MPGPAVDMAYFRQERRRGRGRVPGANRHRPSVANPEHVKDIAVDHIGRHSHGDLGCLKWLREC